ncbi:MAG TPA: hypothetical protein DDW45_00430 [Gammaproteobacteria bacterium]|nr:hypothetical protein [Gammaproteobacteria bacterium]
MDQDAFRQTYHEVNERYCAFEKAILTQQCQCSEAHKFCIAEREGVHCNSDAGQQLCLQLLEVLRTRARFALRATAEERKNLLPHGKAIRIQVGGLRGLQVALNPGQPTPPRIESVIDLVNRAINHFGSLDKLPFALIMRHISAYQSKVRSRRDTRGKP